MRKNLVPILLCFASLFGEELKIEVTDPVYKDGVLTCNKGGVIESSKMRIQAQNFELKDVNGEKVLIAKENLFLVYGKKFLVGDSLSYNFATKQGVLENGICGAEKLFTSGEKIVFNQDGTLTIDKAHLTTSHNKNAPVRIKAQTVSMNEEYKATAKGITVSAYNTPVLYYPSYSRTVNKKFEEDSSVSYRALWEKGQGPLFIMQYRVFNGDDLKVHWRGAVRTAAKDYKFYVPRGAASAIDLDYQAPEKNFKFASRNFYGYDTFFNDNEPTKFQSRYRIQGSFDGMSDDKKIETFGRWDALSDRNMRSDFHTALFELKTLERTEGFIKGRYDQAFTSLYIRPKINSFQGFKQELPTLKIAVKPYVIPKTGAIFENYFKLGYLDYSYANSLPSNIKDFRSGRLETSQAITRPVTLGFLNITPKVGFKGIAYTNGKEEARPLQALFHYDISTHATLEKDYQTFQHSVKPYVEFQGLANARNFDDIYIFGVQDGYHRINQMKVGMKNSFFSSEVFSPLPGFSADLYAYNFFNAKNLSSTFPKGFLDLAWNFSKISFQTNLSWNFQENTYDHANAALSWTLNEYFAASLELRHRNKFEWRKDVFSNYMLDEAHSSQELLNSPLSDERTTFFTRWELRFAPLWSIQVQNHLGWRPSEPFYHESKVDLYTTISNTWRLKLSYARTVRANQVSFEITLI
jgi:hypothetical protein